jgi:hypothetical protein
VQQSIRTTIALDVAVELRKPIFGVAARLASMLWASMPEAPIDEDGDPSPREDDVSSYSQARDPNRIVLPEAISAGVEQ